MLAARQTDGLVVLVPRIEGRYARVGTVAHIDESGRLPDWRQASVFRGQYRAVLNSGADRARRRVVDDRRAGTDRRP